MDVGTLFPDGLSGTILVRTGRDVQEAAAVTVREQQLLWSGVIAFPASLLLTGIMRCIRRCYAR